MKKFILQKQKFYKKEAYIMSKKNNIVTVNNDKMEDQNMENNFYDEQEQNDVQENQEEMPENSENEQQEDDKKVPAKQEKESWFSWKSFGIGCLTGAAAGVTGTVAFLIFKGKKAPKIDTSKVADNIVDFAKEIAEKKIKEA